MASLVHRTVMFKVAEDDKQAQLLSSIEKLAKEARKDGEEYIVYMGAGRTDPTSPRHKGYTVVLQSKFRTLDDMKYFDEECSAHQELKNAVKTMGLEEMPLVAYYEGTPLVDETNA